MNFDDHFRYINLTEVFPTDSYYNESIDCSIKLKPHQLALIKICIEREQNVIEFSDNELILRNRYD
jgi:hypothetical protein